MSIVKISLLPVRFELNATNPPPPYGSVGVGVGVSGWVDVSVSVFVCVGGVGVFVDISCSVVGDGVYVVFDWVGNERTRLVGVFVGDGVTGRKKDLIWDEKLI